MKKHSVLFFVVAAVALLALGLWIGRASVSPSGTAGMEHGEEGHIETGERKVLYWYDPMHPQQHFDEPGQSPFMDMALVPRYADEGDDAAGGTVRVSPSIVQNLGIRSAPVEQIDATGELDLSGLVSFNERALTRLQSPAAAFVQEVWPLAPGDQVQSGQALVRLRIPSWTTAQHEFLAILANNDQSLLGAARERLRSLGIPEERIVRLERDRQVRDTYIVRAPHPGVIRSLEVRPGMTLKAGDALTQVHALDPVWVEIAVPETQVSRVKSDNRVQVRLNGVEPAVREGRIAEILPVVDPVTRTVAVRVTLANPDGDLRPGMSAQVRLRTESTTALAVPTEALLRTGQRTLVMVEEGDGRFRPVEVRVGREVGARTLLLAGLAEGQRVVTSGQFLLDSEASLRGIEAEPLPAAPSATRQPALHYAIGKVEQIAEDRVLLDHGPFESLQMPGMTMRFRLADEHVAHGIAPGDRVRIGVRSSEQGLIVESLEKLEASQ